VGDPVRRRDFITVIAGAATAWPLAARAQNAARIARIGYLNSLSSPSADAALVEGLQDLGWIEGKNLLIERRICPGDAECLRKSAAELTELKVDIIVAEATAAVQAAKSATTSIPIVFAATGDPVGQGFVASLARPGGNMTGTSFDAGPEIPTKQLQLIMETVPKVTRIAVLWNPTSPFIRTYWQFVRDAGLALNVPLQSEEAKDAKDFEPAFDAMAGQHADALIVLSDSFMSAHRVLLARLAAERRLPALYGHNLYTEAGGLMSYGPSIPDLLRGAAGYVDKILKGAKPAELPVQQPVKFDLIINLKTAKALGLEIPPTVLARADQVIE
jgi:putative tryptophan/tyrosine transport system substrate-binding protein